ncbi:hypothetical protein ACIBHX_48995 [Nonomuraea sp. NPDC050536]|uniref:hypothetical protein n=1 Tax=Nonomuraea sp. NPDC050536 TaxID=3364366 RepID=UPI0037C97D6D
MDGIFGRRRFDVDHLVPLAEAWDSAAYDWTTAQRQAYANDLNEPWHLVAVTDATSSSVSKPEIMS